jgi:hypothetical protein
VNVLDLDESLGKQRAFGRKSLPICRSHLTAGQALEREARPRNQE